MTSLILFLLLMGLIVFGPKKTIEMVQTMMGMVGQFKHAASQFQSEMQGRGHDEEINEEILERNLTSLPPQSPGPATAPAPPA
jgi:Sec-independent protein translocase protein TatA